MLRETLFRTIILASFVVVEIRAGSPCPAAGAIAAALNGFHDALHRGDAKAAMELLAPDAVVLESGSSQTHEEYAREHLAEDSAFVKAVPGTRSNLAVNQDGCVAWTTAASESAGTFNGREINSIGVEVMVLTRTELGWRIRAIHWSSHATKKVE